MNKMAHRLNNSSINGASRRALGEITRNVTNERNIAPRNGKNQVDTKKTATANVATLNQQHNEIIAIDAPVIRETAIQAPIESNRNSYQYTGHVDDIDERDRNDPLCVTEYVHEIYEYYRMKETKTLVKPVYMKNQPNINERMRSILVDWLVEVHLKFKLVPETLYLTVNIIDRYLERKEVSREKLQLVGVTALLIASKYEEIYPPDLDKLVYICDRAYDVDEIIQMEEIILKAIQYQVTIPSPHVFLVRYLKAAHADRRIVQLACFILDGTLQSYSLLNYLPSQLAAAAVLIARTQVGRNPWSPTLLKYALYCEEDVLPVARAILREKASTPSELKAVIAKYSTQRYGEVALTDFEEI